MVWGFNYVISRGELSDHDPGMPNDHPDGGESDGDDNPDGRTEDTTI